MPKMLTLSEPNISTIIDARAIKWYLLDEEGEGYFISWFECAFGTRKPECTAFPYKRDKHGKHQMSWDEKAVSHNPDAAMALREVMMQLKEKYGYTYNTEVEIQLLPGEVVADD